MIFLLLHFWQFGYMRGILFRFFTASYWGGLWNSHESHENSGTIAFDQKTAFSANCRMRGPLAEVIDPNEPALRLPFGFPKCGVLSRLKLSARSWRPIFSENAKLLNREKSTFVYPGPRTRFRPASPGVGLLLLCPGVLANAAVLNHSEVERFVRGNVGFSPGTRFGRSPG